MASIMISNSQYGIRSAELKDGPNYTELSRLSGGAYGSMFFTMPSGVNSVPFTLRVTSATYEKVEFVVPQIIDMSIPLLEQFH